MFRRWLAQRLDLVALSWAILTIGLLVAWWAVFALRLIGEQHAASTVAIELRLVDDTKAQAEAKAALEARSTRLRTMVAGETVVFGSAIVTCVLVLFMLGRRRRDERTRLERLLQLTSHELKTPIAGVRALMQSLALGTIPKDQQQHYLEQGVRECDRLEHLAETMLAYQRALTRAEAALQKLATAELMDTVLTHRERSGLGETLVRAATAPAWVWGDVDAFRVVLENLLDNARKYASGAVTLTESLTGNTWAVEVKDTGQGFDPAQADSLFEPFARGGKSGRSHGSGLGLSIARTLARRMGGDLTARSEGVGKGAAFTFTLPVAPRPTEREALEAAS